MPSSPVVVFRGYSRPMVRVEAYLALLEGQRNLAVTADTYTHVLTDETELDYGELLAA